jgi:hypothetical protein
MSFKKKMKRRREIINDNDLTIFQRQVCLKEEVKIQRVKKKTNLFVSLKSDLILI